MVVQLKNVKKSYHQKSLLHSLNLHVSEEETLAIYGKSGTGKSTILNIIGLLDTHQEGELFLFGKKAPKMNSKEALLLKRNRISYLFQNYALIEDQSIGKNLDIALHFSKHSDIEKRRIKEEILTKVNVDLPLTMKIYELSGGEKQRVALARTLLKPSKLILADEPTGSLDHENRNDIVDILLKEKKSGKSIVIVTHDNYIVDKCDRSFSLE